MFIEEFSFAFNLKYIINRFGVVSGPLQFGKQDQGFISLWIWNHITKKKLKYIGFGGFGRRLVLDKFLDRQKVVQKSKKEPGAPMEETVLEELPALCPGILVARNICTYS